MAPRLGRTIPALPVRDVEAAVAYYRERLGFEAPHVLEALYDELKTRDVLHGASTGGVAATDFGTREFHALDADGNLLTFFQAR